MDTKCLYSNSKCKWRSIPTTSGWNGVGNTSTKSVTYDSTYGTLPTPTRQGYTFMGWYTNTTYTTKKESTTTVNITENETLYAKWEKDTYLITYNLNGGSATNPTYYDIDAETFTLNNPTKEGYTFTGWSISNMSNTCSHYYGTGTSSGLYQLTTSTSLNVNESQIYFMNLDSENGE